MQDNTIRNITIGIGLMIALIIALATFKSHIDSPAPTQSIQPTEAPKEITATSTPQTATTTPTTPIKPKGAVKPQVTATSTVVSTPKEGTYSFAGGAQDYYIAMSKDRVLLSSQRLTQLAQARADDMTYFKHEGYQAYVTNQSYYFYVGENLYGGTEDAQAIETRFMGSATHRTNILNPNYTHVGIAVRSLDKPMPSDEGTVIGHLIVVFFGGEQKQ